MTKYLLVIILPLFSVLFPFNEGCAVTNEVKIQYPRFSPANDKLIFNYCRPSVPCTIAVYELAGGGLFVYEAPKNEIWADANYSRDGSRLTIVVDPLVNNKRDLFGQIAIMNVDGSGFRKLTDNPSFKSGPSFSPDGQRIIYARANTIRESGRTRFTHYDVYEVEIRTGVERQLTNYRFFLMTAPFYLPDGKHFIFSGEGPSGTGAPSSDTKRLREEFKEKYQDNTIFIMSKDNHELRPAFVNGEYSNYPRISQDGAQILFVSKTNKMDGIVGKFNYDIFIRTGEVNNRLTRLNSMVYDVALSPDGSRIAFLSDKERNRKPTLWVMNSDGTGLTEIRLPKEIKRLNK